ncbi:hypothetical protein HYPSUDRAFT_41299 [Hypholoma sublateritium FD-334 SS-4]|uniref:NAD-dependent epimerase/dehydratase domain-containing protein n=1 Tax=Hypholoma sublateritium (strain FD-334 SS-4) TaxID=945553 RepID=A0A0D2PQM9_HYPSF|nr:hypothetical protein HYPSUDRAFT_41299 [Hypholoma sublateritium FD-334 SS-4]
MTTDSTLVAFIIGAGSHIGAAVAAKLHELGYKVALGSRHAAESETKQEYFHVQVDASRRESIEAAFGTVTKALGPVNVVVYNAASVNIPPSPTHILSLSSEAYYESAALGLGVFTAAKQAVENFKNDIHRDHPKAFIATGNILPFTQFSPSPYHTLGVQKALATRLIATAAQSYKEDDIKFYFATLVSHKGGIPEPGEFEKSAQTHAEVYWDLINKEASNWDHRFTLDGKPYLHV